MPMRIVSLGVAVLLPERVEKRGRCAEIGPSVRVWSVGRAGERGAIGDKGSKQAYVGRCNL